MKKIYITIVAGFMSIAAIKSQNIPTYQMFNNPIIFNPARAGNPSNSIKNELLVSHAQDWIGLKETTNADEKTPSTYILTSNFSLGKSKKSNNMGLGGTIFGQNENLIRRAGGNVAYSLILTGKEDIEDKRYFASIGISAGLVNQSLNTSNILAKDPDDPILANGIWNGTYLTSNAGVYGAMVFNESSNGLKYLAEIDVSAANVQGGLNPLPFHIQAALSLSTYMHDGISFKIQNMIRSNINKDPATLWHNGQIHLPIAQNRSDDVSYLILNGGIWYQTYPRLVSRHDLRLRGFFGVGLDVKKKYIFNVFAGMPYWATYMTNNNRGFAYDLQLGIRF